MWLKLSEGVYVPSSGLVGIFNPGAAGITGAGPGAGGEAKAPGGKYTGSVKAVVLMRDGTVIESPFGTGVLKARFEESARPGGWKHDKRETDGKD